MTDEYFMEMALAEARNAGKYGEVPVGALVVADGKVYAGQGNRREGTHDPLAHAEVLSLRMAAEHFATWRLDNVSLYSTVEPCLLCSGAIYLARVKRVVFGCCNPKGGALRFVEQHRRILGLNHSVEIVSGVCESDCAQLLSVFFEGRRRRERRDGRVVEGA